MFFKKSFLLVLGVCTAIAAMAQVPAFDRTQVPADAYDPHLIQIRLTPAAVLTAERNGRTQTLTAFGIPSLDSICTTFGLEDFRRLANVAYMGYKSGVPAQDVPVFRWFQLRISRARLLHVALNALENLNGVVELAEPVYKKEIHTLPEPPPFEGSWLPDDSLFGRQWHYHNLGQTGGLADADIDLPEAWEIEKGHPSVVVAVMDNGIDTMHLDLRPALSPLRGFNFVNNQHALVPGNHGNHVAGIIAARSNNASFVAGIAGGDGTAASGARLVSCQIFGVPVGSGGVENAFVWSAQQGVAIASNSWGFLQPNVFNRSVLDAIDYFIENGGGTVLKNGLVVFSGGNGGDYAQRWPGAYHKVIGVTATNHFDVKAWYATFHENLDIAAPGGETNLMNGGPLVDGGRQGILSTIVQSAGGTGYLQGTSMAAPQVSGVAALVASHGRGRLSADDVKSLLLLYSDETDSYQQLDFRKRMGNGRLNALLALKKTQQLMQLPQITPPTRFIAQPACAAINLSWQKAAATDEVMVAVSREVPRGGLFGIPEGIYTAGDSLAGGGRIIYRGTAAGFTYSNISEGETYYFKIWTTNGAGAYSMGIVLPEPVTIASSIAFFQAEAPCYDTVRLTWRAQDACSGVKVLVAASRSNEFDQPAGNYFPGQQIGNATVVYTGEGNSFSYALQSQEDSIRVFYRIWPLHSDGSYGQPVSAMVTTPAALSTAFPLSMGTQSVQAAWTRHPCFEGEVIVASNNTGNFGIPQGLLQAGDQLPGASGTVLYRGAASRFLHTALTANQVYYYAVWPVLGERYGTPKFFSARTRCAEISLPLPFRDSIGPESLTGCLFDTLNFRNFTAGPLPSLQVVSRGANPAADPFSGNFMLAFNSFDTREGNEVWLTSPPLDSRNVASVDVAFKWNEDASDYNTPFFDPEGITLQWSTDYVTWTDVVTYSRITRFGANGWKYKQATLPAAAAGSNHLYVRFRLRSAWGFNCYLDEIEVFPTKPFAASGALFNSVAQFADNAGWTHFYDSTGQLLLSLASGGYLPGHVNDTLQVAAGGSATARVQPSGDNFVLNPGGWASSGRFWSIRGWQPFSGTTLLRQYFSRGENDSLRQAGIRGFAPAPDAGDSVVIYPYIITGASVQQGNPSSGFSGIRPASFFGQQGYWQFDAATLSDTLRSRVGPFIPGWYAADFPVAYAGQTTGGIGTGSIAGNGALGPDFWEISAVRSQRQTTVNWTTGYEREWVLMEIERAAGTSGSFVQIGFASPAGFSQGGQRYSFSDAALLPNGLYRYRIKATNLQGGISISPEATLNLTDTRGVLVFPNPAEGGNFTVFSEAPMDGLRIIDMTGKTMYAAKPGSTQWQVRLPFLASGIYLVHVNMGGSLKVQRVIVLP